MKTRSFVLVYIILSAALLRNAAAQTSLSWYLPGGYEYDRAVPAPDEILGFVPGDYHVSHDQLYYYAREIASHSPRVRLEVTGKTYENRPLILLIITSEENQKQLETIKKEHLQLADPQSAVGANHSQQPVFVWLGHSIHGNEASGANASLLTLYHLAAAKGPGIEKLLSETVIFIDPCENPDGLQRFSGWVNQHRWTTRNNDDPQAREHAEAWPGGRTNHYWFDLNRDWLPLQHPESQARIASIQEWKPNILVDEHEQGTNATFHFSPGEPNRVHPLIPESNQKLTEKIAVYLARGLDSIGSLYTSKQGYDDYYNGRGPTYLDFNGGVALLFEQASSRGYAQRSDNGQLTFPFGVRNQFVSSLSFIRAGHELRNELLEYQRTYYKESFAEGQKSAVKAWVFGSGNDEARAFHLAEILNRHDIAVYRLSNDRSIQGVQFTAGTSYIVPLAQPQFRLLQSIFEKRTAFRDSLFYDISGWTFPLAFNLDYAELDSRTFNKTLIGSRFDPADTPVGHIAGQKSDYAYIMSWENYYAPQALYRLLEKGIIAKVISNTTAVGGPGSFSAGSILIPVQNQSLGASELYETIKRTAEETKGVTFYPVGSGTTGDGTHLGSNTIQRIRKPSVFILAGNRINALSAGEIWHLLDTRYQIPATILPVESVRFSDISVYNTLILPDGDYSSLSAGFGTKLRNWAEAGNVIIAYGRALNWLNSIELLNLKFAGNRPSPSRNYRDFALSRRASSIPGSIVQIRADLTHPLFYGFSNELIPFWKGNNLVIEAPSPANAYSPAKYTTDPLLSGYLPSGFSSLLARAPAVAVRTAGNGRIIAFTDNTDFRGFWYGTSKLLANAIFFGDQISAATAADISERRTVDQSARGNTRNNNE